MTLSIDSLPASLNDGSGDASGPATAGLPLRWNTSGLQIALQLVIENLNWLSFLLTNTLVIVLTYITHPKLTEEVLQSNSTSTQDCELIKTGDQEKTTNRKK